MIWGVLDDKPGRRKFVAMSAGWTFVVQEVHGGWLATIRGVTGTLLNAEQFEGTAHQCKEWCDQQDALRLRPVVAVGGRRPGDVRARMAAKPKRRQAKASIKSSVKPKPKRKP